MTAHPNPRKGGNLMETEFESPDRQTILRIIDSYDPNNDVAFYWIEDGTPSYPDVLPRRQFGMLLSYLILQGYWLR